MTTTRQTLTHHRDIQKWVRGRAGQPAIRREPDAFGVVRPRLTLNFAKGVSKPGTPTLDDGMSPVSWTAWLAELDRQHLALRISDEQTYELIERKDLN